MADPEVTEIEQLHEFFEGWFRGEIERDGFTRMERVMAPDFRLIAPGGQLVDQAAILAAVREARGSRQVLITVENAEVLWKSGSITCARYDERHAGTGRPSLRRSTAVFRDAPATPNGVEWVHVHETWIEPPVS